MQPRNADPIALLDAADGTADADDRTHAFMAGDERRFRFNRPIAVRGVEVGVANPGRRDANDDLVLVRLRNRYFLDYERLAELAHEAGYQLTWMDAKVGDWVVTPRRGKAVEINGLWYNALRLLETWLRTEGDGQGAQSIGEHADHARTSFNRRFWYDKGGYLYDIVDGEGGDDPACRPNQLLAISLAHPVLEPSRWAAVLDIVCQRLLTPVGLRSLAPGHADYKAQYDGDLRARDAAYHQGTVWPWLLGPLIDVWLRTRHDAAGARALFDGLLDHLNEACLGSISEIFDAEKPFTPRGCIAQAWSVAEVLRGWVKTLEAEVTESSGPASR